jgi:hypothetical protein
LFAADFSTDAPQAAQFRSTPTALFAAEAVRPASLWPHCRHRVEMPESSRVVGTSAVPPHSHRHSQ